jgi:hypothetical protein
MRHLWPSSAGIFYLVQASGMDWVLRDGIFIHQVHAVTNQIRGSLPSWPPDEMVGPVEIRSRVRKALVAEANKDWRAYCERSFR